MKKKVLLSSIMTIILCLSLIAGSTFALFTSDSEFNISVTSGEVTIEATAEVAQIYSAKGADEADDKYLVDENKNTYTHEADPWGDGKTFKNGGTAELVSGKVVIDKITPGDRVDIDINVANSSNVAINYRYTISVVEGEKLAQGMVFTSHAIDANTPGKSYEAVKSYTSEWFVDYEGGAALPTRTISLELPVYAGNEYQSKAGENLKTSVEYNILVEAVQANAVTTGNETFVITYPVDSAVQTAIDNGGTLDLAESTFASAEGVVTKNAPVKFANGTFTTNYNSGNFALITNFNFDSSNYVGYNSDITVASDAIISVPDSPDSYGVLFFEGTSKLTIEDGAKIKASGAGSYCIKVSAAQCDLYIENTDAFVCENGAGAINASSITQLTIHVPTEEVKTAIANMITTDTTAVVNIVVG